MDSLCKQAKFPCVQVRVAAEAHRPRSTREADDGCEQQAGPGQTHVTAGRWRDSDRKSASSP